MSSKHKPSQHKEIISKVRDQLEETFEESEQGVYVYLDDINKVCNERFSSMLGYSSPREWAAVKENFPEAFVAPKSRQTLVSTYQKAMDGLVGSMISVTWKKKNGGDLPSTAILVPLVVDGHRMALHFISPS